MSIVPSFRPSSRRKTMIGILALALTSSALVACESSSPSVPVPIDESRPQVCETLEQDDEHMTVHMSNVADGTTHHVDGHLSVREDQMLRIESNLSSGAALIEFTSNSNFPENNFDPKNFSACRSRVTEFGVLDGECDVRVSPDPSGDGRPSEGTVTVSLIDGDAPDVGGGRIMVGGDIVQWGRMTAFQDWGQACAYADYPETEIPDTLGDDSTPVDYIIEDEAVFPILTVAYFEPYSISVGTDYLGVIQKQQGHTDSWTYPFSDKPLYAKEKRLMTPYGEAPVEYYYERGDSTRNLLRWSVHDEDGIEWQYRMLVPVGTDEESIVASLR